MSYHKQIEIREHSGAVYDVCFDGTYLYSASADKFVTRWNLETGQQDNFAIKFEQSPYAIDINGNLLIIGLANSKASFSFGVPSLR